LRILGGTNYKLPTTITQAIAKSTTEPQDTQILSALNHNANSSRDTLTCITHHSCASMSQALGDSDANTGYSLCVGGASVAELLNAIGKPLAGDMTIAAVVVTLEGCFDGPFSHHIP